MDYHHFLGTLPPLIRNCHLILTDYKNNPSSHIPYISSFYQSLISQQLLSLNPSSHQSSSSNESSPHSLNPSSHQSSSSNECFSKSKLEALDDLFEKTLGKWSDSGSDSEVDSEVDSEEPLDPIINYDCT